MSKDSLAGQRPIRRIAVFCGASNGARESYARDSATIGKELAKRRITIVYGGGRAGLMGVVADSALEAGGEVIGVITKLLQSRELAHTGNTELHVVETMHERKMMMATLADAFIALPGGLGTFDELFEILAWAQLGIHAKPVGLVNTDGFYDELIAFLHKADREKFVRLDLRSALALDSSPAQLIASMLAE